MSDARFGWLARLFLIIGTLCSALWFVGSSVAASASNRVLQDETSETELVEADGLDDSVEVRFNFKDQTWDEIIDFFSRSTGLPVVRETEVPPGTVTYIYPEPYPLPEALETLNILLQTQGVMVRRERDRLYLQKLSEMQRENIPTFVGKLPSEVTDDQVVTILIPLVNATPSTIAEQLANLVASYGSVTALPRQNAVIVVETAAQIRRIQKIINEIDREDVENILEYIPIRHSTAQEMVKSLTSLMSERIVKYVVNSKGKQVKVEDEELPGLKITPDERTNAIIVKGTRARIDQLKETIVLLDVPQGSVGDARMMRTVSVSRVTPQAAAAKLREFFASVPAEDRPTVVPLEDVDKITIVGDSALVENGIRLLTDLDDLADGSSSASRQATELLAITHGTPKSVIEAIKPMLGSRTSRNLLLLPGPDGASIIVTGPAAEITRVRGILDLIDRPSSVERAVEFLTLQSSDPARALQRAMTIYDSLHGDSDPLYALEIELDETTRGLTLTGGVLAIDRFRKALAQAEAMVVAPRTVRQLAVTNVTPSAIQADMQTMAAKLLDPRDGTRFEAPRFESIDELGLLIVESDPSDLDAITTLLAQMDVVDAGQRSMMIDLEVARAAEVKSQLEAMIAAAPIVVSGRTMPEPTITEIEQINALRVLADEETLAFIRKYAAELDTIEMVDMPPMRFLQVRTADVQNLARSLTQGYAMRPPEERASKPVRIEPDLQTNSLVIMAHPEVFEEIAAIVTQLNDVNRLDAEDREIRIFPLRVARAEELARTLDEMFPQPPLPRDSRGRARPDLQQPREVVVRADRQTNSIIVDAPTQRMAGFQKLVDQLDRTQLADESEIRTWKLLRSELDSVARTLTQISNAGGFGSTDAAGSASVLISTEPASSTLLVSGPPEVFAQIDEIITALESSGVTPPTGLRFFRLETARAGELEPLVREILAARLREEIPGGDARADGLLEVSSDRKTNMLIIQAPESVMSIAAEVIEQLDSGKGVLADPVVRVRALNFADPANIATALRETLPTVTSPVTGAPVEMRFVAAPGSNALIMVGLAEDLDLVDAMIEPLDATPSTDAVDARTFELKHAEARELAPIIERMLVDQVNNDPRIMMERLRRSRGQMAAVPGIKVDSDPRTNTLVVSGPKQMVALARSLIDQLDRPEDSVRPRQITFTPRNVDPARLVPMVERVAAAAGIGTGRSDLELVAVPEAGTILVFGSDSDVEQISKIMSELDARSAMPSMDLKIVEVTHADGAVIASTLQRLLSDRSRWPAALRNAVAAGVAVESPTVSVENGTNRLLVTAPASLMPVADALIAQLDQPSDLTRKEVRVYPLMQARATEVADALRSAMEALGGFSVRGETTSIIAEPSSNSIVVTGSPNRQVEVAQLLSGFESGISTDGTSVRTILLKHARAEVVAPMVSKLIVAQNTDNGERIPSYIRRYYASLNESPDTSVKVEADSRLNAVVVAGPASMLAVAQKAIEQLDVDPASDQLARRSVRVLTINNADADKLAASLRALFADGEDGQQPPVIEVDLSSNALLVRATTEQFDVISRVTRDVDEATVMGSREIRTIPIDGSRAEADDVARLLERMLRRGEDSSDDVEIIPLDELLRRYGNGPSPSAKPDADSRSHAGSLGGRASLLAAVMIGSQETAGSEVTDDADIVIAVDPETNSLIVLGSPRAVERVRALAAQAQDELPDAGTTVRTIPLPEGVSPVQLRTLVSQTLRSIRPSGGGVGDLARRVGVIADENGRSLIITASDADFETVASLIAAYARQPAAEELTLRSYSLENVSSRRASDGLSTLLRRGKRPGVDPAVQFSLDGRETSFDTRDVHVVSDVATNSLMVLAPVEAFDFIEDYLKMLDQETSIAYSTIKTYEIRFADAAELSRTFDRIFTAKVRSQRNTGTRLVEPEFVTDERTNSLIVTASSEQFKEVESLLDTLDSETTLEKAPLTVLELAAARPSAIGRILDRIVIGDDQSVRASTMIIPDDDAGVLVVRAEDQVLAEIRTLLSELDRDSTAEFPVRSIVLERADAGVVARVIQRFYDDRARIASGARGRKLKRQVAVVGDTATATLLVSATESEFEEVRDLVERLDSVEATKGLEFRVFPLKHARAAKVNSILQEVFGPIMWMRREGGGPKDQVMTAVVEQMNAILVTGNGEIFDTVAQVFAAVDQPASAGNKQVVRVYQLESTEVRVARDMVREALGVSTRWWDDDTSSQAVIEADGRSRVLIVAASEEDQLLAKEVVDTLNEAVSIPEQNVTVLALEYAPAGEVARTLLNFLRQQSESSGKPRSSVSISSSNAANTLLVSASKDETAIIKDLVSQIDMPDSAGDRAIEILPLGRGEAVEIARLVSQQFPRRSGTPGIMVTADARTNSLIVNAPKVEFAQVEALVEKLDGPPMREETLIRTFVLETAEADQAMVVLQQALALDADGRTTGATVKVEGSTEDAVEVVARIVSDNRSNSLVVAATNESFPVIEELIERLEGAPSVSSVEYRIIPLKHAEAREVTLNLDIVFRNRGGRDTAPSVDWTRDNQLVVGATPEQFEMIETILGQLDKPGASPRQTQFLPLQFAEADKVQSALSYFYGAFAVNVDDPGKKNVQIAADLATNSLVISADENEWPGIRSLIEKLDSAEYDSSLQLTVLALNYADARSVARAINEAFRGPIEQKSKRDSGQRQNDRGDRGDREEFTAPTILVEAEEWVSAAAEEQTNTIVVSASRKNLEKIEGIITQLDVADFMKLPPPRLIPVLNGSPSQLASSLQELYTAGDNRGGATTRILADDLSGTIIVRADDAEYAQIAALAEAIQQKADAHGLSVHVLALENADASNIVGSIRSAFTAQAQRTQSPLSLEADLVSNSVVVACTGAMWSEIRGTIQQMDRMRPSGGQGVFIIELENVPAAEVLRVIESIGLDSPSTDGAAGRLVVEPVRATPLEGRNALLVAANPADKETLVSIARSLDQSDSVPGETDRIGLVALRNLPASNVAETLRSLFDPASSEAGHPMAEALREQARRLKLVARDLGSPEADIDLTKPVRLVPNDDSNLLMVVSSQGNVRAVEQLAGLLDQLPSSGSATVRLFPLENIGADDFIRIVNDLYAQGESLGDVPGGMVSGVPTGAVGRALMENMAITKDDRTNTVIAAGSEDGVAFIEVLVTRLDSEVGLGWVEARVLPLRFADAEDIAELIEEVLVEGSTELPASVPLQNQAARLRVGDGGGRRESQIFVPMARLVIRPDKATNSLLVVGTPSNLGVVQGLLSMLDVESAFPGALVRIYPVENASAARLAVVLGQLFESQIQAGTMREDDRVEIIPDERTNALVVSTTGRSFAILEQLLETLDTAMPPELREIRTIELTNASSTRIASIVQRMMDARVDRLREVQPETAELERVLVLSDERTNALIVAAGEDTFETVKRLARDLDEAPDMEHGDIAVVPVETGAVDRLAQAIERLMERRYAELPGDVARGRRPLVIPDARTSSLLVAADPEDLSSIRGLVTQLAEVPTNPAVGLHVVPLDRGDVEQFAGRLENLMQDRARSLGDGESPSDQVSISADPVSRSIIVASNEENLDAVRTLLDALVRASAENAGMDDVEIITLMNQDAENVVELLEDMYVEDENRRRGEVVIRVSSEERLNAVVVNAPTDDRRAIRRLVTQLDETKPSQVVEIKYIALGAANAVETVSLIENVLAGNTLAGGRGSEQSTVIRYLQKIEGDAGGGVEVSTEVSSAIRESISLTPDVRTNTIVVRAPREAMELIDNMIRDLDSSTTGNQDIRVFRLANADAEAMADILGDLFNLQQQGDLYVLKPRDSGVDQGEGMEDASALGTDLTLVPDQRQSLSITVDNRTNALLVSGTPTYLDLVSGVVEKLDAEKANERDTFVYPLRNAQASEIARVVGEFVAEDQRKLIETLGSDQLPSASRLLEREVTIVGDEKSNSVLVNASPRYREKVMDIIRELDIDPPQVLIQVLLAEITLDDDDESGITVNDRVGVLPMRADFGFIGSMLGGSISAPFEVSATDLSLTLAAVEAQSRFQLLSNPSITVANNEEGYIQVGETLRLPEAVQTFEQGTQNTTVTPEEVGTILRVTPTINPEGFVRMVIAPEISKLSDQQLQISTDFNSPIIKRRTATTTVTVRDGNTVIIGGLIRGDFERTDQKIPLLGDLPLIGGLFRSEDTRAVRTELVIVLTPHVIKDPTSQVWSDLTEEAIQTLPIPDDFKSQIQSGRLDSSSGILNQNFEIDGLEKLEGTESDSTGD